MELAFLEPVNAAHRQYEALRAYFIERLPSKDVAAQFGYTAGSFRVLCHDFRADPQRQFFLPDRARSGRVVAPAAAKTTRLRARVVAARKQNLSVYDIARLLAEQGETLSPPAIWAILKEEGFARLPRRAEEERPDRVLATRAATADIRQLDLSPREFRTEVGGLFLFVPMLARLGFDELMARVGLPGTTMVPSGAAMRALLALKLFGAARTTRRPLKVNLGIPEPGHVLTATVPPDRRERTLTPARRTGTTGSANAPSQNLTLPNDNRQPQSSIRRGARPGTG